MTSTRPDPSKPGALLTWRGNVAHEWVDYNGHLRDAYYLLIFSFASDSLMEHLGLDAVGRKSTGHSLFTLECHLNFLREVKVGNVVDVYTQVLAHDQKRLHIFQSLRLSGDETPLAVNEMMLLNVEMAGPRAIAFESSVLVKVEALASLHAALPKPELAGRAIGLSARA